MKGTLKRVTLIVPVLLLMFSPLPIALGILNQQSTPQVVFSDDFESYASTATCNSVNDNCFAPPHIGNKMNLPSYWVPASSDTCVTRGGCTKWDGNGHMGPNSVFAVVTEQAASGSKSIKLGASDWYADKTSMAVWLSLNNFPSGQLVSLSFKVWLSLGIDNPACHCNKYGSGPNNALTIQTPVGKIRYFGQIGSTSGLWEVQNSPISTGGLFANIGSYHLTTQTWHTITLTFDWTNSHWDSLVIDGQQPFANVNGYPTYDSPEKLNVNYDDFAIFIVPYADYQSITSASTYGFQPYYAYVDDFEVSLGTVNNPTQTNSTTTSTPIAEFGVATTIFVATVFVIAAIHLNKNRKYRKELMTNSIH